jgi:chemotaxis protein MotB
MRGRRNNGSNGLEAWPGYVDALSTLLMVTIFVLLVFVLAEAFLSSALKGSDNTIDQLRNQIAQLTQSLSIETAKDMNTAQELSELNAQLSAAQSQNSTLNQQLTMANGTIADLTQQAQGVQAQLSDAQAQATADQGQITSLQQQLSALEQASADAGPGVAEQLKDTQGKLVAQQKISAAALAQVELLNQQIAAMRLQLASLSAALDAAKAADAKDNVQIVDLGKQLNEALARKVAELQQYQSEFFKIMKQSLAGQQNIRVDGDRFIFQSDVLFPVDSATLTPAGKDEIADVAKAVIDMNGKIPPDVNWILSVEGYADAQPITGGPYHSNFDLSSARALTVLHLLVKDGVPAERLSASALGSNNPIATGNTADDYAQNRRIEFRLTTP